MSDLEVEAHEQSEEQPQPEPEVQPVPDEERVRYEDDPANQPQMPEGWEPAPLSAEEVDPEASRRDETTVLATDRFDSEGNRIK